MNTTMQTLLGPPSILLDPERLKVELTLADAQAIASYIKLQPLGEVLDIFAPLATGIRIAMSVEQRNVLETVGKSAVNADEKRRAEETKGAVAKLAERVSDEDEAVIEGIARATQEGNTHQIHPTPNSGRVDTKPELRAAYQEQRKADNAKAFGKATGAPVAVKKSPKASNGSSKTT